MLPEIALNSILIIVALLFPGLIFRRFFYAGKFAKQFSKGEWSERIVISVFWGVLTQLLTILIFSYLPWVDNLLKKQEFPELTIYNFSSVISQNREIFVLLLSYILFSNIISGIIGYVGFKVIRIFRLDIHFPILQFSNSWHYYFSGETKSLNHKGKILFTWIDLVIKTEEEPQKNKMIQGALKDYTLDTSTGNLEYLYLENARRYSHSIQDFKSIHSDIFIVPFQNVIDMNIRYEYEIPQNKKAQWKEVLMAVYTIVGLISCLVLPWFFAKDVGIWRILLSYVPSFFIYLTSLIVVVPFPVENEKKITRIITFTTLFIVSFLSLRELLGY